MVYPETVIAGCGNPLFADDGFGPAVAEELRNIILPDNVIALDAGTSGPQFLFPMLDPEVTKKIIIVDITDFGGKPGSVILFRIDDFHQGCIHDAHIGGIIESLLHIRNRIEVTIIGCQPKRVTYPDMEIGLSDEVRGALPATVQIILNILGMDYGNPMHLRKETRFEEFPDTPGAGSDCLLCCTMIKPWRSHT
jgi:coenzyme F420 hydrogenase subunit delta